jgi:hypothetical protein
MCLLESTIAWGQLVMRLSCLAWFGRPGVDIDLASAIIELHIHE